MSRDYEILTSYLTTLALQNQKSVYKATRIMTDYLNHKISAEDAIRRTKDAINKSDI